MKDLQLTKKTVLVIGGPTASAKSQLALDLACSLKGVIINADSLQVYRDLPLLTAHPSFEEYQKAPHSLYGFLEPKTIMTGPSWADLALEEIVKAHLLEKIPILVGGTGFYLKVLMEGLSPLPSIPLEIREKGELLKDEKGLSFLWEELKTKDPESFLVLSPRDTYRILRAWEIYEYTKIPLSAWHKKARSSISSKADLQFLKIFINPPRATLREAILRRTQKMIEIGVLKEVQEFLNQNLGGSPLEKALGLTDLQAYLEKQLSLNEAVLQMTQKTRQYAKRQHTWFKHQFHADIIYPFLYEGDGEFFKNLWQDVR